LLLAAFVGVFLDTALVCCLGADGVGAEGVGSDGVDVQMESV
jgi:hypothetical protein